MTTAARDSLPPFLRRHRLPRSFQTRVDRWYAPLAEKLARRYRRGNPPLLVGINGCQGSGKSTLAALLEILLPAHWQLAAIALSIDDFYRDRHARRHLADRIHPLLSTRGVPGTHDTELLRNTLERLMDRQPGIVIPGFDKATDNPFPRDRWRTLDTPIDVILLEGWCLGTPSQPESALRRPVNELESREDPDGRWRRFVNQQIDLHYQPIYQMIDFWIMLQAPNFDCVYQWRREQEQKLPRRSMSDAQLRRFIAHFQRLTEHALRQLPDSVDHLLRLDARRNIIACAMRNP